MKTNKTNGNARKLLMALFVTLFVDARAWADWLYVERVIDGDTFVTKQGTKVRIEGVDTPEIKGAGSKESRRGAQAKKLAQAYLEGNFVWADGNATDKYGRRVAKITLRGNKSYADIVKSYDLDKNTGSAFSLRKLLGKTKQVNVTPEDTKPYRHSPDDFVRIPEGMKKDGTWVHGEYRLKSPEGNPPPAAARSTSTNREIQVKGYFRKDGTYVRPHTRSLPPK